MIPFPLALALVAAVQNEPLDQRMAPRAVALEIAREAEDLKEAATLAVMAWEEGRLRPDAVGDQGRSRCVYQLQRTTWSVLRDLRECTHIALERLRASAAACPDAPLAAYASGNCGHARVLSARRMAKVWRILRAVSLQELGALSSNARWSRPALPACPPAREATALPKLGTSRARSSARA